MHYHTWFTYCRGSNPGFHAWETHILSTEVHLHQSLFFFPYMVWGVLGRWLKDLWELALLSSCPPHLNHLTLLDQYLTFVRLGAKYTIFCLYAWVMNRANKHKIKLSYFKQLSFNLEILVSQKFYNRMHSQERAHF